MKRAAFSVSCDEEARIKEQALDWAHARFSAFLFLDSCGYEDRYGEWEWLLGTGEQRAISMDDAVIAGEWLFGHMLYDEPRDGDHGAYTYQTEKLGYGRAEFFVPEILIGMKPGSEKVILFAQDPASIWQEVLSTPISRTLPLPSVRFQPAIDRDDYLKTVEALRQHIAAGDCYEINLCNVRTAETPVQLDALSAFRALRFASPAPFSALLKWRGQYSICASPERFLCGWERRIISQPIKGTAPRGHAEEEDALLIAALHGSAKERAENIMIVDLVRSDLARSCVPGTVTVDELFGIQTFPAVHQMVSTVSGRLRDDQTWWDATRHAFPMGSMTGAPKEKVMELIARYEPARRGRFSGAIGYITPDGDFDLAVVIRSLFYNERDGSLWYSTGGAITWASDPAAEWEETLLKGAAIEKLFGA